MPARTPNTIGALGPTMITFTLSMRAEGKKPKTVRTYAEAAVWLAQRHPAESWDQIGKTAIREHMAYLIANYSPAYASNQYRALQSFFSWLNDEEEIANPMTGMKPPAAPETRSRPRCRGTRQAARHLHDALVRRLA